jgi:hypothetical protein
MKSATTPLSPPTYLPRRRRSLGPRSLPVRPHDRYHHAQARSCLPPKPIVNTPPRARACHHHAASDFDKMERRRPNRRVRRCQGRAPPGRSLQATHSGESTKAQGDEIPETKSANGVAASRRRFAAGGDLPSGTAAPKVRIAVRRVNGGSQARSAAGDLHRRRRQRGESAQRRRDRGWLRFG